MAWPRSGARSSIIERDRQEMSGFESRAEEQVLAILGRDR